MEGESHRVVAHGLPEGVWKAEGTGSGEREKVEERRTSKVVGEEPLAGAGIPSPSLSPQKGGCGEGGAPLRAFSEAPTGRWDRC